MLLCHQRAGMSHVDTMHILYIAVSNQVSTYIHLHFVSKLVLSY